MEDTPIIGRLRGIEIRAHLALLLVPAYLAYLAAARFPQLAGLAGVDPRSLRLPAPVWGLLLAALVLASLAVHEAAHVLVVRAAGGRVTSLTLLPPGGRQVVRGLERSPGAQALAAAAGPLGSLATGAAALVLGGLAGRGDLRFGLAWLAYLNLGLAAANLLPGLPMDGGIVLQAALSRRMPRQQAGRHAARLGAVLGALLLLAALVTGSLPTALLALLVWAGAHAELQALRHEERARSLVVRDVMSPARTVIPAQATAARAADQLARAHATALPVADGPVLLGVVALRHLHWLPAELRERTPVSALVARDVPRLHADEPLPEALARLAERHVQEAPVLDRGRLVGVLEIGGLGRALRLGDPAALADPGRPRLAWRPPSRPAPQPVVGPAAGWPGLHPGGARA